ncbi:hypothetical protein DRN44_04685 [Thermococci archaeon]|nr:MAG: hypothetical protein DRN44_04685 [Thermococci archaeon]
MSVKSTKDVLTQLRKFFDSNLLDSSRVEIRGNSIVVIERDKGAKLKKMIIKDISISSENIVRFHVSKEMVKFFKNKDNCETAILLLLENNGNHKIYVILPEMKSSIKTIEKYEKAIKQITNTALSVVMILRFVEVDVLDESVVRWYGVVGVKLGPIDMDTIMLSRTAKTVSDNEYKLYEQLIKREELSVELPWNNSLKIIKKGFVSNLDDTVEFSINELV